MIFHTMAEYEKHYFPKAWHRKQLALPPEECAKYIVKRALQKAKEKSDG